MEHRIRSVDAVILTHGHADAIAGLGALTLHKVSPFRNSVDELITSDDLPQTTSERSMPL